MELDCVFSSLSRFRELCSRAFVEPLVKLSRVSIDLAIFGNLSGGAFVEPNRSCDRGKLSWNVSLLIFPVPMSFAVEHVAAEHSWEWVWKTELDCVFSSLSRSRKLCSRAFVEPLVEPDRVSIDLVSFGHFSGGAFVGRSCIRMDLGCCSELPFRCGVLPRWKRARQSWSQTVSWMVSFLTVSVPVTFPDVEAKEGRGSATADGLSKGTVVVQGRKVLGVEGPADMFRDMVAMHHGDFNRRKFRS
eukprot:s4964_g2.t1